MNGLNKQFSCIAVKGENSHKSNFALKTIFFFYCHGCLYIHSLSSFIQITSQQQQIPINKGHNNQ